jgi:hypothetical protein
MVQNSGGGSSATVASWFASPANWKGGLANSLNANVGKSGRKRPATGQRPSLLTKRRFRQIRRSDRLDRKPGIDQAIGPLVRRFKPGGVLDQRF